MDLDFILKGILWITAFWAQVSIHEWAHAWMAWRLGDGTAKYQGRLTLNPLAHIDLIGTVLMPILMIFFQAPVIGWAKPVPVYPLNFRHPYQGMMLVALAGPISNVLLALGLLVPFKALAMAFPDHLGQAFMALVGKGPLVTPGLPIADAWLSVLSFWVVISIIINVILAVFNLVPVPPLDGSRVLTYFLPDAGKDVMHQLEPFGFLIVLALLWTDILDKFILSPALAWMASLLVWLWWL